MKKTDTAKLIAYLGGKLPNDQVGPLENRLKQDDALARHLQAIEEALDEGIAAPELEASIARSKVVFDETVATATLPGTIRKSILPRLAMAAALAAVLVAGFWLFRPSPDLLAGLREPATNLISMRSGADNDRAALAAALVPYDQGDFSTAIESLGKYLDQHSTDPAAQFYLGVSYFLEGNEAAATALRATIQDGDNLFIEEANWYLALSLLDQGQPEAAKPALEEVVALAGKRKAAAAKLLTRLD